MRVERDLVLRGEGFPQLQTKLKGRAAVVVVRGHEYRQDLRTMLEAKLSGQEIAKPEPVPETPVVDLMDALKRSVAEAQDRKKSAASAKKRAAPKSGSEKQRRTPARKSA